MEMLLMPYQSTPVRECTVAPNKDISSNRLTEHLNPKHISNKLLSRLEKQKKKVLVWRVTEGRQKVRKYQ
jgi:hypothetical protein